MNTIDAFVGDAESKEFYLEAERNNGSGSEEFCGGLMRGSEKFKADCVGCISFLCAY